MFHWSCLLCQTNWLGLVRGNDKQTVIRGHRAYKIKEFYSCSLLTNMLKRMFKIAQDWFKRGSTQKNCTYFNASAVKNLKNCSGRQMPPRGYRGVKCHLKLLGRQMPLEVMGRQMPLEVIGASNATQGFGASNATLGLYGSQRPHRRQKAGVKVHKES